MDSVPKPKDTNARRPRVGGGPHKLACDECNLGHDCRPKAGGREKMPTADACSPCEAYPPKAIASCDPCEGAPMRLLLCDCKFRNIAASRNCSSRTAVQNTFRRSISAIPPSVFCKYCKIDCPGGQERKIPGGIGWGLKSLWGLSVAAILP